MIELAEDFRDLLVEFHDAGAEFVVVGGYAVAFHGHPRATEDLDNRANVLSIVGTIVSLKSAPMHHSVGPR